MPRQPRDFSQFFATGGSEGDRIDDGGDSVAVVFSISGSLPQDVPGRLELRQERVGGAPRAPPESRARPRECLRGAGDAVALAETAEGLMRNFVRRWKAKAPPPLPSTGRSRGCLLHRASAERGLPGGADHGEPAARLRALFPAPVARRRAVRSGCRIDAVGLEFWPCRLRARPLTNLDPKSCEPK